jgi:anti-sigma regulatory factor (Ser/Thr protein kinase)
VTEQATTQQTIGPIDIRVPAEPSLSRVLRLAASGVASLAGFTVDEIENIKIAVSEILIALIEHGGGKTVDIQFAVTDTTFQLTGRTETNVFNINHPDLALCRTVLAEVCVDHRIDRVNNEVHIWAAVAHEAIG